MIDVKIIKKPKKAGTVTTTGGIATVGNSYTTGNTAKEAAHARHADEADHARQADEALHAQVADQAKDLTPDSPIRDEFLSKKKDDRTPHRLNVGDRFTAESGAWFGNFVEGMSGGRVDKDGNMEMESGIFRSFLQIYELIVNRQRTMDSDIMLSEGDTVEYVTELPDSADGLKRYRLKIHPEWEGYTTAMHERDIIRGVYNNITNSITGDGTNTVHGATYYTSWMLVTAVDTFANTIDVTLYADADVPAGRNFPPTAMLKVNRHGNDTHQNRQRLIYFSGHEGRIRILDHVTHPKTALDNEAVMIGRATAELAAMDPRVNEGDPVAYFKHLLAENLVKVDHQGRPDPEIVFRGEWDPAAEYYDGTALIEDTGKWEQSVVVYCGCQWLCTKAGNNHPPVWDSTYWSLYLGDPNLSLQWAGSEDSVWADNPEITLAVTAWKNYQDITSDPNITYDWTRESVNGGTQDTMSDQIWNDAHQDVGPELPLTMADMNYSFGRHPEKLTYTVTATLTDPSGRQVKARMQITV